MTYVVEELEGSPTFSLSKTEATATRMVRVAWDNVDAFSEELFRNRRTINGNTIVQGAIFPGRSNYRAVSCTIEPMDTDNPRYGGPGSVPIYPEAGAKFTIQYQRIEANEQETEDAPAYVQRRISVGGEFLTLPNEGLEWENEGAPKHIVAPDVQAGVLIPIIEHEFVMPALLEFPIDKIRKYIGHVNKGVWRKAEDQTVLFTGAEINFELSPYGDTIYQVTYRFSERRIKDGSSIRGWNYFMDVGDDNKWKRVLRDKKPIYNEANLEELFKGIVLAV